jgi:hypothetical protein
MWGTRHMQTILSESSSDSFYFHNVSFDEYEIRDDGGLIQIIEKSRYFDFVNTTYPWYKDIRGKAQHIRVWSQNIVSEVITKEIPAVSWQYA